MRLFPTQERLTQIKLGLIFKGIGKRLRVCRGVEPDEPPKAVTLNLLEVVIVGFVLGADPRLDWAGIPVAFFNARVVLVVEPGQVGELLFGEEVEGREISWEIGVLFTVGGGDEGV